MYARSLKVRSIQSSMFVSLAMLLSGQLNDRVWRIVLCGVSGVWCARDLSRGEKSGRDAPIFAYFFGLPGGPC